MKHILALLLVFAGPGGAHAQSVVATNGAEYSSGAWNITQTIGEPVIATVGNGTAQLTQGFEQPWADVLTAVDDVPATLPDVNVYPNPVRHVLDLAFGALPVDTRYELFDALGRSLLRGRVSGMLTEIDMERYASGGYLLRVTGANYATMRSFKINVTH